MSVNSHYVPQLILRRYGAKINLYNIKRGRIIGAEDTDECYCTFGRYSNELEVALADRYETRFSAYMNAMCGRGASVDPGTVGFIRKFVFISYLRGVRWDRSDHRVACLDILEKVVSSDEFPDRIVTDDSELRSDVERIQEFLLKSEIALLHNTEEEDFLLCDVGPVFDDYCDPTFASYTISPDTAIVFHTSVLQGKESVVYCNNLVMEQCVRYLTYSKLSRIYESVQTYAGCHSDGRYDNLKREVERHHASGPRSENVPAEARHFIDELSIPEDVIRDYLDDTDGGASVQSLVSSGDYVGVAVVLVLQRYGLLNKSADDDWISYFELMSNIDLHRLVTRYSDNSTCEFDKCVAAVFTEVLASRGHLKSTEKIGRLYQEGKHLPVDKERSLTYYMKAAECGSADAIKFMVGYFCNAGDERSALKYLCYSRCPDPVVFLLIGNLKRDKGDIGGALKYYDISAKMHYTGAFANLFKIYLSPGPYFNLNKAEAYVQDALETKSAALDLLIRYYERSLPEHPEYLERIHDLLDRMDEHDIKEAVHWRSRYPR